MGSVLVVLVNKIVSGLILREKLVCCSAGFLSLSCRQTISPFDFVKPLVQAEMGFKMVCLLFIFSERVIMNWFIIIGTFIIVCDGFSGF